MKGHFFHYLILIAMLFAGCTFPLEPSAPVEVDFATAIPYIPTLIPTETMPSSATQENAQAAVVETQQPTSYILDAKFDVLEHKVTVNEQIVYLNETGNVLNRIAFMVPMNHASGVFTLTGFSLGKEQLAQQVVLNGVQFDVNLITPLQPDTNLQFNLQYEILLPDEPGVLGYTERQINVCDWYVFIPPYQPDTGWMTNAYHAVGEYLVYDTANFDVTIEVANASSDLILVGSGPGIQNGNTWTFAAEQVRTFVWTASDQYEQLVQAENPQIIAYVFPEDIVAGWSALATTVSAWNLYSAIYGAPPQEQLFVIEADFYDGMEYDGLFYLGFDYFESYNGGEKNYLTAIAAHETAHQWWFASVGNDAANEPWLDESLAIYSELLFYETYYSGNESWWWKFRVDSFDPAGAVNDTIYPYETWRPYINAVYLRGAQMIRDLRTAMGDEAFFLFLQAYYRAGSGKIMTRKDFFNLAAQFSDADIQKINEAYFSE